MSNSDYAVDVDKFWPDNEIIAELKKIVVKVRTDKFGKADALRSKMGQEIYPYFDEVNVELNPTRSDLIRDKNYKDFLQDVLNGVKPIKDPKAISPPKGRDICAVLLAWLSDCHPEYAVEFLDTANAKLVQLGTPEKQILFRVFQSIELNAEEDATNFIRGGGEFRQHEAPDISNHEVEASLAVQSLLDALSSDETNSQTSSEISGSLESSISNVPSIDEGGTPPIKFLYNKIIKSWMPPELLPEPKKNETWKITDRWHPRNAAAYWLGWRIYFLGFPKKERYYFDDIIWTKNDIRAVAKPESVRQTVFSFSIEPHEDNESKRHKGVALFGKNDRYGYGDVKIASADPKSTVFVFCDELALAHTEHVQHGYLQKMHFKPPSGDSQYTEHMYRHPCYKIDKEEGIGRYKPQQVLAVNSDGDIIVFGSYGYTSTNPESQIDIFELTEGKLKKIDKWDGKLKSQNDLLPHPRLPKLFFRKPDRVERVCDTPIVLLCEDDWTIASERHTVAWHPELPIILVNGAHNKEKNTTALLIVDLETNTYIAEIRTAGSLKTVAWSPNGRFIYFATVGNALSRWDLSSNSVERKFSGNSPVERISISPSGDRVAVQNWSSRNNIAIFDLNAFEVVAEFTGTFMDFNETPWHYSGRYIAYGLDGEVLVRRLEF